MKSILIVVAVIFAGNASGGPLDKLNFNLIQSITTCAANLGITPDQIIALSSLQVPTETPVQCFLACVAKKMELMNSDNTFQRTTVINTMKPLIDELNKNKNVDTAQVMNQIADTCVSVQTSSDECAAAKNAFECFVGSVRKSGL